MLFFWHEIWFGSGGACLPEYVATNFATSCASFPTTMFWGMIAPEKPPFSIAYRTRIAGRSQRTLKLGPLLNWAVNTLAAEPKVAAYDNEWHPAQRSWKSTAPWCSAVSLVGTLMRSVPHAAPASAIATVAPSAHRTLTARLMGRGS